MKEYRIVIPASDRIFIQYRQKFPWPCWRRMKDWYCSGFDIESRTLDFVTVKDARRWISEVVE